MIVPPGMTEAEVLAVIDNISSALTRFAFGPYDEDDIRQQVAVFCLEALEAGKYDPRPGPDGRPTRPLANYLFTHSRNRLINFHRDKCRRADPPCRQCHESIPGRTPHEDGQYCPKYESWLKRNLDKQNILCPSDISDVPPSTESEVEHEVETSELLRLIDRELPASLRGDYLRLKDGESLPKARRVEVENAVKEIIRESLE